MSLNDFSEVKHISLLRHSYYSIAIDIFKRPASAFYICFFLGPTRLQALYRTVANTTFFKNPCKMQRKTN